MYASMQYYILITTSGGCFKNIYELLNLRARKFSRVNKIHIFQCMGKILCVEFQRYPLKFHTKYLTHTLTWFLYNIEIWRDLRAHTHSWNAPPGLSSSIPSPPLTWRAPPVVGCWGRQTPVCAVPAPELGLPWDACLLDGCLNNTKTIQLVSNTTIFDSIFCQHSHKTLQFASKGKIWRIVCKFKSDA